MPAFIVPPVDRIARNRTRQSRWFDRPAFSRTASIETVAVTTQTSGTAMTSPLFVPAGGDNFYNIASAPTAGLFTITRGAVARGASGNALLNSNVTIDPALNAYSSGASDLGVSFMHTGQKVELVMRGTGNSCLIRVDGVYVTADPVDTGAAGTTTYALCDFGTVATRRIDVCGRAIGFGGVNIAPTDSLTAAPVRGPRCIAIGDSFTGSGPVFGWTGAFADAMGWDDVWGSGVGGSGYLATNGGAAPRFRDRVARDVIAFAPDIVMIVGSINDDSAATAALSTEANLLYAQIRSGLPNALVFAAPTANGGVKKYGATKLANKAALKAAALANGVAWLDLLEQPLTFADGAAPAGTVINAWTAGATSMYLTGEPGQSINPQTGSTVELGSGATRERIHVKSVSQVAPTTVAVTFDGALTYAHALDEPWVQVGPSYLTGGGRVGGATGFGNSDLFVSNDGAHPSGAGGGALGLTLGAMMRAWANGL